MIEYSKEEFHDVYDLSTRRTFLKAAASFAAGGLAFSSCGQAQNPADVAPLADGRIDEINESVTAYSHPVRVDVDRIIAENQPKPKTKHYYPGELIRKISTSENVTVLSFDDGPDKRHEYELADIANVRGYESLLFWLFVANNVIANPKVARDMHDRGYIIGNHTETHSRYDATGETAEIGRAQEKIHSITGEYPWYFRAAGGTMSHLINNECARHDLAYIWTSGDELDYKSPRVSPKTMNDQFKKYYAPGYISLRHSGGTHDNTVAAMHGLFDIIEGLGIQVVSIDDALSRRNDGFDPAGRLMSEALNDTDSILMDTDEFYRADGDYGFDLAADIAKVK